MNLGCLGETTESFLDACEYEFATHVDYTGLSQLDAALAILHTGNRGVGTITISRGANDLFQTLDDCGDDPASTDEMSRLNDGIATAARTTRSKLANAYDDFNVPPPQPQRLGRLTLICNQDDIHARNAGYREIANLMFTAAGYPASR